jgi:uncharacterized repeat protein (TIGR03803 family)
MKSEFSCADKCVLAIALAVAVICIPCARAQTFRVVHSFTGGSDGGNPVAGLTFVSGELYGTASVGGASGSGAVYKINATGAQSTLYSFTGGADGSTPESRLLYVNGSLFGTTFAGGASKAGTVFQVTLKGKETVLYSFTGGVDGSQPESTLIRDSAGNLYGTTFAGGRNGNGVVFQLVPPKIFGAPWTEKVLYSFGTGGDGANPIAGLTRDSAGNLYGTTSAGGTYTYGTVFQLKPSSSGWKENILYQFQLQGDGGVPYAGLVLSAGNLYGAATDGGGGGNNGGGTIFKLTPAGSGWSFQVIYRLSGTYISGPYRNLLLTSGNIYATTHCDGANSAGTVFQLTPSGNKWNYTLLYEFTGGTDGLFSFSSLVFDSQGYLWGTTKDGGAYGSGVVFRILP